MRGSNCKSLTGKIVAFWISGQSWELVVYERWLHMLVGVYVPFNRGRISSFDRALDCRAGGCGFDSLGWTNTLGLKITEK